MQSGLGHVLNDELVGAGDSKRYRMSVADYPGMGYENVDPTNATGWDENNAVGSQASWTSDGVNDVIDHKLVVAPPKWNKNWLNDYPLCSVLFAKPLDVDLGMDEYDTYERAYRPLDTVTMLTPEQMNYVLALQRLDGMQERKSLYEIYQEWKVIGVNTTGPAVSPDQTKRVGDERVLNCRPRTAFKVLNYFGDNHSGVKRPYCFWVLKEAYVPNQTSTFVLDAAGKERIVLENRATDKSGKPTETQVKYFPRWTAVTSNNRHAPSMDDLRYHILEDGKVTDHYGFFVYMGRTVRNMEVASSLDRQDTRPPSHEMDMLDMRSTCMGLKMDMLLDVSYKESFNY